MKKRFEAPIMEVQRLAPDDVFTGSDCRVEAKGCASCYCVAVTCNPFAGCDAVSCTCWDHW